jgi:hypothetical protein
MMIVNNTNNNKHKMKLHRSKKGFFTDALVDAFSFIAIVIIIVIFSVIFQLIGKSGAYDIKGAELKLDSQAELLQILKTPIEIDGYKTDIAGYVIYSKGDKKKIELLQPVMQKLIDDIVKKSSIDCIDIEFEGYHGRAMAQGSYPGLSGVNPCAVTGAVAIANLPSSSGIIPVQIWAKTKK